MIVIYPRQSACTLESFKCDVGPVLIDVTKPPPSLYCIFDKGHAYGAILVARLHQGYVP